MKLHVLERNGLSLLAGNITSIREGTGKAEGKVVFVTITGKMWSGKLKQEEDKSIEIGFWNSEDDSENYRNLATRIHTSNLQLGDFISVLCRIKDENHANALQFKRSGIWSFKEEGEIKERNVIIGTMASMKEKDDGSIRFSVPIYHGPDNDTEWVYITFRNSDRSAAADRAKLCLMPKEERKVKAIVMCGQKFEMNTDTEKPVCFFPGYWFDIIG